MSVTTYPQSGERHRACRAEINRLTAVVARLNVILDSRADMVSDLRHKIEQLNTALDAAIHSEDDALVECDQQRARADVAEALAARIPELEGVLSGDPSLTATKEEREAWRWSAIRYADKLEKRIAELLEKVGKAVQLALIASDWNLSEVEIDGEMVNIHRLIDEFNGAIMRAHEKPPL